MAKYFCVPSLCTILLPEYVHDAPNLSKALGSLVETFVKAGWIYQGDIWFCQPSKNALVLSLLALL
jgi:hypothetical protein